MAVVNCKAVKWKIQEKASHNYYVSCEMQNIDQKSRSGSLRGTFAISCDSSIKNLRTTSQE